MFFKDTASIWPSIAIQSTVWAVEFWMWWTVQMVEVFIALITKWLCTCVATLRLCLDIIFTLRPSTGVKAARCLYKMIDVTRWQQFPRYIDKPFLAAVMQPMLVVLPSCMLRTVCTALRARLNAHPNSLRTDASTLHTLERSGCQAIYKWHISQTNKLTSADLLSPPGHFVLLLHFVHCVTYKRMLCTFKNSRKRYLELDVLVRFTLLLQ